MSDPLALVMQLAEHLAFKTPEEIHAPTYWQFVGALAALQCSHPTWAAHLPPETRALVYEALDAPLRAFTSPVLH